jgi:4-amino-4-deoxy-L-arabinose transferase-like glycosyltransferase
MSSSSRTPLTRWLSSYSGRIGLISVAGLAGRLLFLGYQPLWRDEAFTAVVVQHPLGQMLDIVRRDSAPPLPYLLDHVVASFWSSPAGLRLISAVAGACAIPLGAAMGRRIAGDRGGILSAAVCALTPALVFSARDARMYALATTLVMATTLLLWRAVERPSPLRWSAYAAVSALALYTQYFVVLAVAAQLVAVPLALRAGRRTTEVAGLSAGIACLTLAPWLLVARDQFAHASDAFWIPRFGFLSLVGIYLPFYSGPTVDPWIAGKPILLTAQGFCAAAGVLVASAWLMFFRRRLSPSGRRAVAFLATCGVGAVLLLMALSVWRPLLDARYASVLWGPLFPLVGAGLALVRIRILVGACLVAVAAPSVALSVVVTHPNIPAAVALLDPRVRPHDLVEATPAEYLLLAYYGDRALLGRTHVVSADVAWFWGTAAFPPGTIVAAVPADVPANAGVIYLVRELYEPGAVLPPGYRAVSDRCWTEICVTTYAR